MVPFQYVCWAEYVIGNRALRIAAKQSQSDGDMR